MALVGALAHLCEVFLLACIAIACGTRLLRSMGLRAEGVLEEGLYSAGLFFATLEVVLFFLAMFGLLRQTVVLAVLGMAAILAGKEWLQFPKLAASFLRLVRRTGQSPLTFLIGALTFICFAIDGLMAMAPLTGSDALHYHFTVPLLEIGKRAEPIFWITHSFFVGDGHLLISLGMALGSDRISLGLIYLGGVLTAGCLFALTRKLVPSERLAWVAVLAFLLTPMVCWQMSTSGSPDIWMAFYTTLVVLAMARAVQTRSHVWWLLVGIFSGTVAGAKYTGLVAPIAVVAFCFVVLRSWKWTALCGLCSLATGSLPLVRNALWTGDPFFPFLTRWLAPATVNNYALRAIIADTHASALNRNMLGLIEYPFLLSLKGNAYGVGQYFGPLILAFAPLLILSSRRGFVAYAGAGMWAALLLFNALTSQMARFLLPAFPLALALVFCGAAEIFHRGRAVRVGCHVTLLLFFLFGASSEALYAKDFLPVALGLESQSAFLSRMAPDYETTLFINRSLAGQGKIMVFFRHLYYLDPPFLEGHPDNSWLMNPQRLGQPQELLDLLHRENIRWVVKSPGYPEPFAQAFRTLEIEGQLHPVSSAEVSTLSGFRIYKERVPVEVTIMEVAPSS